MHATSPRPLTSRKHIMKQSLIALGGWRDGLLTSSAARRVRYHNILHIASYYVDTSWEKKSLCLILKRENAGEARKKSCFLSGTDILT